MCNHQLNLCLSKHKLDQLYSFVGLLYFKILNIFTQVENWLIVIPGGWIGNHGSEVNEPERQRGWLLRTYAEGQNPKSIIAWYRLLA